MYLARSRERSAPGAEAAGSTEPVSTTSMRGHGLGFLWQKSRKSNACSFGSTTRFACTYPGASPAVGLIRAPSRNMPRSSAGLAAFNSGSRRIVAVVMVSSVRLWPRICPTAAACPKRICARRRRQPKSTIQLKVEPACHTRPPTPKEFVGDAPTPPARGFCPYALP